MSAYEPIFPLHNIVFPKGRLTLQIFEPRYLDMVSRCLRTDTGFVLALIEEGDETGDIPRIFPVGTRVKIADWEQGSNGLLNIVVEGIERVSIQATRAADDHLLQGVVQNLQTAPARTLPPEFDRLAELLGRILDELGPPYAQLERQLDDAAWVADRLTELLPLEPAHKHELLNLDDPLSRLFLLRDRMLQLEVI